MATYRIHLASSDSLSGDVEGQQFAGDDEAVRAATKAAVDVLNDEIIFEHDRAEIALRVERDDGALVARVRVSVLVERFAAS